MIANHFWPRISSGMSGIGGRLSIRTMLATSSGACAHQSRYARRPSALASDGNSIAPAYASAIGSSSRWSAVTMA